MNILIEEIEPASIDGNHMSGLVREVLEREGVTDGQVTVAFIDDAAIQSLNMRFLARDRITDVLAFSLGEPGEPLEGEIYISVETARRNSAEYSVSLERELSLLVIHGLLHLAGYDDSTTAKRRVMRDREQTYLDRFRAGETVAYVPSAEDAEDIGRDDVEIPSPRLTATD